MATIMLKVMKCFICRFLILPAPIDFPYLLFLLFHFCKQWNIYKFIFENKMHFISSHLSIILGIQVTVLYFCAKKILIGDPLYDILSYSSLKYIQRFYCASNWAKHLVSFFNFIISKFTT